MTTYQVAFTDVAQAEADAAYLWMLYGRGPGAYHHVYPDIAPGEDEKQAILRALQHTGGNRTKAAELLAISIRTLRNKLKEYSLEVSEPAGV